MTCSLPVRETGHLPRKTITGRKTQTNTVMELTATHRGVRGGAAHLLRAAAAHHHVRRAEHVIHVSPPEAESDCQIGER